MQLIKTIKMILTSDEILASIAEYEAKQVIEYDMLWQYYLGKNAAILSRALPDPNNPNNKIPIPYGKKIITTFVGYAYRPHYITYKSHKIEADQPQSESLQEETYVKQLQKTFDINNEHIKTTRAGRNTAIFGAAYELIYIDNGIISDLETPIKAEPKFISVDPREIILFYDYSSEPKKVMALRFYRINEDFYKVEMYYRDKIILYDRMRKRSAKWELIWTGEYINYFDEIPVVAYYFGDEMQGLIKPIIPLIDCYDILISDSMNEFDRFAFAYLIMKKVGLTDPIRQKDPNIISKTLQYLKRRRVFENLPADADIKFLLKDIPSGFIQYMSQLMRDQIHIQSHVPDFSGERMAGASGIAIQRLLFDFENIASAAEADFDLGLLDRIRLITKIYDKTGSTAGNYNMVTISHKRNLPLNLIEFAQTAEVMKRTGFSSYLVADVMPDDVIPNVEEELKRQEEEKAALAPDIEKMWSGE